MLPSNRQTPRITRYPKRKTKSKQQKKELRGNLGKEANKLLFSKGAKDIHYKERMDASESNQYNE